MTKKQLNEFIKIHENFHFASGRHYDHFFGDSELYEITELDTLESIKTALPVYIDSAIEVFDDFLENEFGRTEDEYTCGILSLDGLDYDCEIADRFVEDINKLISFLDAKDQEKYTKIFQKKIADYKDSYDCQNEYREERRLLEAIRDNDFDEVESMLKRGVDHSFNMGWPKTPSGSSSIALETAEELGYDDIAELLMRYGAKSYE